jgi:hypothetical protein
MLIDDRDFILMPFHVMSLLLLLLVLSHSLCVLIFHTQKNVSRASEKKREKNLILILSLALCERAHATNFFFLTLLPE